MKDDNNSIIHIITGVPFLNIYVDEGYDHDKHAYTDTHSVLINIMEISSIEEYTPDDEDYTGPNGIYITMRNDDNFISMDYTINEFLQKMYDAGCATNSYDEY